MRRLIRSPVIRERVVRGFRNRAIDMILWLWNDRVSREEDDGGWLLTSPLRHDPPGLIVWPGTRSVGDPKARRVETRRT